MRRAEVWKSLSTPRWAMSLAGQQVKEQVCLHASHLQWKVYNSNILNFFQRETSHMLLTFVTYHSQLKLHYTAHPHPPQGGFLRSHPAPKGSGTMSSFILNLYKIRSPES